VIPPIDFLRWNCPRILMSLRIDPDNHPPSRPEAGHSADECLDRFATQTHSRPVTRVELDQLKSLRSVGNHTQLDGSAGSRGLMLECKPRLVDAEVKS